MLLSQVLSSCIETVALVDRMVNKQSTTVKDLFNEAQSQRSSRKHVILLRQAYQKSDPEDFTTVFLDCLNRVLICRKSDSNADRVLKYVAHFISLLEGSDAEESEAFGELTSTIIKHLLRGIESKEKNVRYRICQLLALLMTSGLSEIDEDLFDTLQNALLRRVRDRESNVRVQAVIALSRFQSPPEEEDDDDDDDQEDKSATKVTEVLLHLLSHDPSPEVRRAVLHNLSQSTSTLPFLLERARDNDPVLRRQMYTTIMPAINGFKPLSISKRNRLLKWGLKDRDETVRRAAQKMFAVDWLNLANGSILELLQRLDIVNSSVGEDVMDAFFHIRHEFISQITFDDLFWETLSPESAFLVRCMNDYTIKEDRSEVVSEKLPELSTMSDLIVKHIATANQQEEAEKADTEFIIDNLLKLARNADFRDEIGRRRLISNCHEVLRSGLNETLLITAVEVLSKVSINELEFTKSVREIITDLYDVLEDEKEANESFHSADSALDSRDRSVTPQANNEADEVMQVKYIFTTLRVLAIVDALLQHISGSLQNNASLTSLLNDIIVPAYRSHEGPICERGIECLGLICLLDQDLAKSYLGHFLNCFAKGYDDLKILALKCVTDILMAHPSLLLPEANAQDEEDAKAAQELGGENSSLEDDLVRIYLKAFQLEDVPEVTASATQSVSKLLLFNILGPDSPNARGLLKEMIILYYSPHNTDNQSLRQNLAYFFPVYAFSSSPHQAAVTSVVVPVLKRLARLYESLAADEKDDLVPLLSVSSQLMDWTNPQRLAQEVSELGGQMELVQPILKRIATSEKEESRALSSALSKIAIAVSTDLGELLDQVNEAADFCSDVISKRMIMKFKTNLEKARTSIDEDEIEEDVDTLTDETPHNQKTSEVDQQSIGDLTMMTVAESTTD